MGELAKAYFLIIIEAYMRKSRQEIYQTVRYLLKIFEFLSSDCHYILHHSYHWVGASYFEDKKIKEA